MLVVLDQPGAGKAGRELLDDFFHLVVFQPRVDNLQLLPQYGKHDHFGEVLSVGVTGVLLAVQIKDRPAQPVKLVEEGFLDVVALVELDLLRGFISAVHKSSRAWVLTLAGR